MKKIILVCLSLLMIVGLFTGCGAETQNEETIRTVVDMQGKTVELPSKIDSYCVLYSSAVPMCAMMDKNLEHMVMYPISSYFEYWYGIMFEGINDHAVQVDKKAVTAEQILESGAQVVFWNRAAHEELVASLEASGVACVNVQVKNSDDLIKALDVIADTFGTDYAQAQADKYESKTAEWLKIVDEHASKIPESEKKSVLVIGDVYSPNVGGPDSYQGYWTNRAGFINASPVKSGEPDATLTMEEIYELDPDVIIAQGPINRNEINNDAQWKEVRAMQENMLFANPSVLDEWGMPTTESPLQFMWVLTKFYPEYASDINASAELIDFYKEFYGYEMSSDDANAILDCHHFFLNDALKDFE